jgi:hypothetical protein
LIIRRRIAALCWIAALTLCVGMAGASPTLPPGGQPQGGVMSPQGS